MSALDIVEMMPMRIPAVICDSDGRLLLSRMGDYDEAMDAKSAHRAVLGAEFMFGLKLDKTQFGEGR